MAKIRILMCLLACAAITYMVPTYFYGNYVGDKYMSRVSLGISNHTPGYLVDFFHGTCNSLAHSYEAELETLETFNRQHGWRQVTFRARHDLHTVSAWYMPSLERRSPLVVVAHPSDGTWLHNSVQSLAFYLRQMGYGVLLPLLTARGFAQLKGTTLVWDLLGALDYLRADPDGLLGGPVPDHHVGFAGFGLGALAALLAFAAEPTIPGVLLDGAVLDPEAQLSHLMALPYWPLLFQQAWSRCEMRAGMPLSAAQDLEDAVRARSAGGYIGQVRSLDDEAVPPYRDALLRTLGGRAAQYNLSFVWETPFTGERACRTRGLVHLDQPEAYKEFTCSFWAAVFGHGSTCGNHTLP